MKISIRLGTGFKANYSKIQTIKAFCQAYADAHLNMEVKEAKEIIDVFDCNKISTFDYNGGNYDILKFNLEKNGFIVEKMVTVDFRIACYDELEKLVIAAMNEHDHEVIAIFLETIKKIDELKKV